MRQRLVFGEVPTESAEPFDPYSGELSRAWLQDVQVDVDELPAEVCLTRRYAFRFLRILVAGTSASVKVKSPNLHKEAGLHAVLIYSVRRTAQLARLLEKTREAEHLEKVAENMAAGALFDALEIADGAVRPADPYFWHHVVEAFYSCGREAQALTLIRSY